MVGSTGPKGLFLFQAIKKSMIPHLSWPRERSSRSEHKQGKKALVDVRPLFIAHA